MSEKRPVRINLHDTHIGIWGDIDGPMWKAVLGHLRRRGWAVALDQEIVTRYRSIAKDYRAISKGAFHGRIQKAPAVIEIELWTETWVKENQNGHRHDFNKRQRLTYLDRIRLDLEIRKLLAWLGGKYDVCEIKTHDHRPAFPRQTADAFIAHQYKTSWHVDKTLGRTVCNYDCNGGSNGRSRDGHRIEHGATVYYLDHKGRFGRGVAHYDLNSAWWIRVNDWHVARAFTGEIWVKPPALHTLRQKHNGRARRERLERELSRAKFEFQP